MNKKGRKLYKRIIAIILAFALIIPQAISGTMARADGDTAKWTDRGNLQVTFADDTIAGYEFAEYNSLQYEIGADNTINIPFPTTEPTAAGSIDITLHDTVQGVDEELLEDKTVTVSHTENLTTLKPETATYDYANNQVIMTFSIVNDCTSFDSAVNKAVILKKGVDITAFIKDDLTAVFPIPELVPIIDGETLYINTAGHEPYFASTEVTVNGTNVKNEDLKAEVVDPTADGGISSIKIYSTKHVRLNAYASNVTIKYGDTALSATTDLSSTAYEQTVALSDVTVLGGWGVSAVFSNDYKIDNLVLQKKHINPKDIDVSMTEDKKTISIKNTNPNTHLYDYGIDTGNIKLKDKNKNLIFDPVIISQTDQEIFVNFFEKNKDIENPMSLTLTLGNTGDMQYELWSINKRDMSCITQSISTDGKNTVTIETTDAYGYSLDSYAYQVEIKGKDFSVIKKLPNQSTPFDIELNDEDIPFDSDKVDVIYEDSNGNPIETRAEALKLTKNYVKAVIKGYTSDIRIYASGADKDELDNAKTVDTDNKVATYKLLKKYDYMYLYAEVDSSHLFTKIDGMDDFTSSYPTQVKFDTDSDGIKTYAGTNIVIGDVFDGFEMTFGDVISSKVASSYYGNFDDTYPLVPYSISDIILPEYVGAVNYTYTFTTGIPISFDMTKGQFKLAEGAEDDDPFTIYVQGDNDIRFDSFTGKNRIGALTDILDGTTFYYISSGTPISMDNLVIIGGKIIFTEGVYAQIDLSRSEHFKNGFSYKKNTDSDFTDVTDGKATIYIPDDAGFKFVALDPREHGLYATIDVVIDNTAPTLVNGVNGEIWADNYTDKNRTTQLSSKKPEDPAGSKDVKFVVNTSDESGIKWVLYGTDGTIGEDIFQVYEARQSFALKEVTSEAGEWTITINEPVEEQTFYIYLVDNAGNVKRYTQDIGPVVEIGVGFGTLKDDKSFDESKGCNEEKKDETYYLNDGDYLKFSSYGQDTSIYSFVLKPTDTSKSEIDLTDKLKTNDVVVNKGKPNEKHVYTYFIEDGIDGITDGEWTATLVINNKVYVGNATESGYVEADKSIKFIYDNTAPVVTDVSIKDSSKSILQTKQTDLNNSVVSADDGRNSSYEKTVTVNYEDTNLEEYKYNIRFSETGKADKPGHDDDLDGEIVYTMDKDTAEFGGISYFNRDIDITITDKAGNVTTSTVGLGPVIYEPTIAEADYVGKSNNNSGYVATSVGKALDKNGNPVQVLFSDKAIEVANIEASTKGKFIVTSGTKSLVVEETGNVGGRGEIIKTSEVQANGSYKNTYNLVLPREWANGTTIGSGAGGEDINVKFVLYQDNNIEPKCTDFKELNKKAVNNDKVGCAVVIDNSIPTVTFGEELKNKINEGSDNDKPRVGYIYEEIEWNVTVNATEKSIFSIAPVINVSNGPDSDVLVKDFTYKSADETGRWNPTASNINTAEFKVATEGKYNSVALTATNKAGTVSDQTSISFIYDKTSPDDCGYTVSSRYSNDYEDYQFIDSKPLEVKMDAKDAVAGIRSVVVKQGNVVIPANIVNGSIYDSKNGGSDNSITGISFLVAPNFKGQIYVDVTDEAFNVTRYTIDEKAIAGVISEGADVDDSRISVTTNFKADKVFDNIEYYGITDTPQISISAGDDISGIRFIKLANSISGPTVDQTFPYTDRSTITNSSSEVYVLSKTEGEYVISAELEDNAGKKTSTATRRMVIDTTVPVITSNVKAVAKEFQNTDVTVAVTIDEKYLNEAATIIKIYNEGTLEKTVTGGGSQNLTFASDGRYYFTVEATDKAGNQAVIYDSKADLGMEFTVDKTAPKLNIVYDNNNVANGKYYRDTRTGTLTIEDHNFDGSLVNVTVNGSKFNASFSGEGTDVHRAAIPFTEENDYTLNISVTDKAGNAGETTITDEFTVDLTDPEINITNVDEGALYSEAISPSVSITDKNYDANSSKVDVATSRTEAGGENARNAVSVTPIPSGQQWRFEDFKKIDANDDYYTLSVTATDLSGRTSTKSVEFMVDRFGSYFLLGTYTQEIVDRVYTNLEGNGDLTIEEYNLADIESREVYFTVGEDTVKLNENDGYTVKSSKNDAHYNVNVYTFDKSKFDKEGEYNLVVSTKDTEGNASDNVSKKAEAKFIIDRTNPDIAINNVEDGGDYEAESVNAEIIFHDNIALGGAKVTINDKTTEYDAKQLAEMNNSLSQDFSDGTYTIKVEATDAAGNVTTSEAITFKVYKNAVEKALDIQTETGKRNWLFIILGGVLIIGLAAFFIILAKRKKDDEEKK